MAAVEDLGELVNKPLADVEAEDPLSKTPASVHPDKNAVGDVLGSALPSKGRGSARERKQVDFFAPQEVKPTEKLVVKEGKGTRLGDIPNVAGEDHSVWQMAELLLNHYRCGAVLFRLQKTTGRNELLEDLHTLLYRRKGKLATRKKEISNFSGFTYPAADKEAELKKDAERLNRWKIDHINQLLDLLDLPRGKDEAGTKDGKIGRIVDFLEQPQKVGTKDLQEQEAKKKAQVERKRKRSAKAADKKDKAEARAGRKADKAKRKAEDGGSKRARKKAKVESDDEDEGEEGEELEDGVEEEEDDTDKLPLGIASKLPSDAELEQDTLAILKSVNVVDFSLKQLLEQLGDKHGVDFNKLKQKKQLIKRAALMYVSAQSKAQETDEDEAEDNDAEPDELEQEAKDEIMEEAGIPKDEQADTTVEDAITALPAAGSVPAEPAEAAATQHLEAQPPAQANVDFNANNA